MPRKFKSANYEETLDQKVSLREVLPPNHLAGFVVDLISQLDLSSIYSRYAAQGGEPFAPEILLGLLFYGYATGVFSSRKIEKGLMRACPFGLWGAACILTMTRLRIFVRAFWPS